MKLLIRKHWPILKEMFDPVFEKIKYVYSHPKIVAEKIKERLGVNNQSQGGMIYRNGGTVSQSGVVSLAERYGHRATAYIMMNH